MSKDAIQLVLPLMQSPEDAMLCCINGPKITWYKFLIDSDTLTVIDIQEYSYGFRTWCRSYVKPEFLLSDDVIELPNFHKTVKWMNDERVMRKFNKVLEESYK